MRINRESPSTKPWARWGEYNNIGLDNAADVIGMIDQVDRAKTFVVRTVVYGHTYEAAFAPSETGVLAQPLLAACGRELPDPAQNKERARAAHN